jgi:methylthioribose-1-phosphate isomerase
MPIETISWKKGKIRYIDQTLLPHKVRFVDCSDIRRLWRAIRRLEIRGAPAIGIAGALGIALAASKSRAADASGLIKDIAAAGRYLASSRPTAVNLFWAIARMRRAALSGRSLEPAALKRRLVNEALRVIAEDKASCRAMARHGAKLIKAGDGILTHCNAGGLATADYGTALGVLFEAKRLGRRIKVYADETRPLLQGARLTAWELMNEGMDVTLICDNMAASLMAKGRIDKIFVGADRIASNGDAANKIGTYSLAVLAKHHGIPFYVVAPLSTFDFAIKTGREIPIEERPGDEVRSVMGKRIAPRNVKVYNPAFDVTPNELITAIVTDKGVVKRPNEIKRRR